MAKLNDKNKFLLISILFTVALLGCTTTNNEFRVIAHRGASGYLPENTLASKALAYGMGVDYIEQDVVITRDNKAVVFHDLYLERITNVREMFEDRARNDGHYYVLDFTLEEIQSLELITRKNKFGEEQFPDRENLSSLSDRIPTFAQELSMITGLNRKTAKSIGIYVEIKDPDWHLQNGKDISAIVLSILADHGYENQDDNIFLQSFSATELKRLKKENATQLKTIQLIGENSWNESPDDHNFLRTRDGLASIARYASGIAPRVEHVITGRDENGNLIVSDIVDRAHKLGLIVHVYVLRTDSLPKYINSFDELVSMLRAIGVDGAFTDFPDILLEKISK
jgi:glycerophosphoryl diester phosphodiesterase